MYNSRAASKAEAECALDSFAKRVQLFPRNQSIPSTNTSWYTFEIQEIYTTLYPQYLSPLKSESHICMN